MDPQCFRLDPIPAEFPYLSPEDLAASDWPLPVWLTAWALQAVVDSFSPFYRRRSRIEALLGTVWEQLDAGAFDVPILRKRARAVDAAIEPLGQLGYTSNPQFAALNLVEALASRDSAPCFHALDRAAMSFAASVLYRQGVGSGDRAVPASYEWDHAIRFHANARRVFLELRARPVTTMRRSAVDSAVLVPAVEPLSPELRAAATTSPPAAERDYWSASSVAPR